MADGEARLVARMMFLEFSADLLFLANEDQFGIGFALEESEGCRDGHGGAVVAAHAVDGNFDCHLSGWTAG